MDTTTVYDLRYPEPTDDVRVHEDIQALAEDVDTVLSTEFGIIGHWARTSDKTSTGGTEVGVIRIDNLALKGGVHYEFYTDTLNLQAISGETGAVYIRLSTSGNATTSSAQLTRAQGNPSTAFQPVQSPYICASYFPSSDVSVSVLLSLGRTGGSGNVILRGSSDAPIRLKCRANGRFPVASGVDI